MQRGSDQRGHSRTPASATQKRREQKRFQRDLEDEPGHLKQPRCRRRQSRRRNSD